MHFVNDKKCLCRYINPSVDIFSLRPGSPIAWRLSDIGIAGLNLLILSVAYLLGATNMCQWRDTEHYVSTVLNIVSIADVHAASVNKTVVKVIKKRNCQTIRVYRYGLANSCM